MHTYGFFSVQLPFIKGRAAVGVTAASYTEVPAWCLSSQLHQPGMLCWTLSCRLPTWRLSCIGAALHQLDAAHLAKAACVQHLCQQRVQGARVAPHPVLDWGTACNSAGLQVCRACCMQLGFPCWACLVSPWAGAAVVICAWMHLNLLHASPHAGVEWC